jgi:hypothetical protein
MVVKVPNIPGRVYTNSKIRITVTQEEIVVESLVKQKPNLQTYAIPEEGQVLPGDMSIPPVQYQQPQQPRPRTQMQHPVQPPVNDTAAKLKNAKRTMDAVTDFLGFGGGPGNK